MQLPHQPTTWLGQVGCRRVMVAESEWTRAGMVEGRMARAPGGEEGHLGGGRA